MNVYLDLEQTVVDSWDSGLLVNSTTVKDWLERLAVKEVSVFSFAVWNEQDQQEFWRRLHDPLTRALGVTVKQCPSFKDFMKADTEVTGVRWDDDLTEFIAIRGKVDSFRSWCRLHHNGEHCVLVDDVVPNGFWQDVDSGFKVDYVNVTTLG